VTWEQTGEGTLAGVSGWGATEIPELSGRTVVVTGGNGGLGAVTVRVLAGRGARVVVACRDVDKGRRVAEQVGGAVTVARLDLADLRSVREFAEGFDGDVDVLVNNAGVFAVPLARTVDGFEMQFGTNHLGHFALTGLLLDRIRQRVVTVSSVSHRTGRIDFDDPNYERRHYNRWGGYGQAKLANLLFAYELQRRLRKDDSPVRSIAAHPGFASTGIGGHTGSKPLNLLVELGDRILAQSAEMGALPQLYAATAPDAEPGGYYGPDGFAGRRGRPARVKSSAASHDEAAAARLWDLSQRLTGVKFL
jgi:NAD(P)-dependent dehydrogenase (short-subunit alcohol dehydrogenase family)